MRNIFNWMAGGRSPHRTPKRRLPNRGLRIEALEQRELMSANVAPVYTVTNSWNSGFQADMRLESHQAASVANWKLEFDLAANITSIWNAKITSRTGNHYTVVGESWANTLPGNGAVGFGFVAAGASAKPANYLLNGDPLGSSAPTIPSLTITDVTQNEGSSGAAAAVFTVTRSAPAMSTVKVSFATVDGTAKAGSDYTATSGTLTFAPGETSKKITVQTSGDTQVEADEAFYVDLSSPVGATVSVGRGTGTLKNDDAPPVTPPSTPSGDFQFAVSSDWNSGFTSQLSFRNGGAAALTNWQVEFDFDGAITSIWDAKIVSHTGKHYVVQNASYNSSIPAGGTMSFGFNGSRANATMVPTNYLLTGASVSGGSTGSSGNTGGSGTTALSDLPAAVGAWPAQVYAPYVDMGLYPMYDLAQAAQSQGVRHFTLAFVVADPQGKPSWGGYSEYGLGTSYDAQLRTQITSVRALGGDVIVSFGGASGQELAQVITNPQALAQAYQSMINAYGLTHIDFDIEGAAVADRASVDRRNDAIAILQANAAAAGKALHVSYTLPVLPTGLTHDGLYVVQSAANRNVNVGVVNVMAMDYGDSAAPNPQGRMGQFAIAAAESLFTQLKSVYGSTKTDTQLWSMVGVTPMIGLNDVTTETFDQQAARELLAFARQKGIGRIAIWSLNRDRQNTAGAINYVDLNSSSVVQQPFEFSQIFLPFSS